MTIQPCKKVVKGAQLAIEFNHFSPHAFERMVQSLCVGVLGPGTVVFGPGPDGGREATFEGEVRYPSEADRWRGYIVVQAKCRERLRNNHEDADWLCAQLKEDLDKFLDPKRKLRKPQYYINASNVALSSHPKSGGKSKISGVFQSYKRRLKLKGYAVWSAEELRAFLEGAENVRRAYTAWLTPSDVLADLVDSLKRPNLSQLLPLALIRDVREERDVRLRDAGQETEKPIFLEDVFIDLPLASDSDANPEGDANETSQALGVVSQLLRRAGDKLDLESLKSSDGLEGRERKPLANRIVLLGGPGQGKSTLTQFLAQGERARLLSVHSRSRINPQTTDLIDPILKRASTEKLWLDCPVRFPIRVNIPGFADALKRAADQKKQLSLLMHIAARLSRDVTVQISADDLRAWLGTCPSLIILDGLDEVPPTANRIEVIRAIEALWDDLHHVEADSLVLVTTRPQGYNHDLDPLY